MKTKSNPLSELPARYRSKNKKWFVDIVTGQFIHARNIHKFLPKPPVDEEEFFRKRWDLKY